MSAHLRPPTENLILKSLPSDIYARLAPHLEPVALESSQIIHKAHDPVSHFYFPDYAIISVVSIMSDGATVEVGVVGREGASGINALLGHDSSPNQSLIQVPGSGLRIKTHPLLTEFKRGGVLQNMLLRYVNSLIAQVSQTAACNRLHTVEERLARWLLMTHDRTHGDELPLTHEFIAQMLGTRRAGVTGAAIALQTEGFIRYSRGNITILDRAGLEGFACECYKIVKREFDRALGNRA